MRARRSSRPIVGGDPAPAVTGGLARLEHALHRLYALCGALAALAIVLIAVLVATSVVSRLLGIYMGGLTEGAGYAMAAAGSLGLASTFGAGGHLRVDLVLNAVGGRTHRLMDQLALLLTAAAVGYLAWYLARMVLISWQYGDLSDGSDRLPLWLPQLPAAFGFVVLAIALVHGLVRYLVTGRSPVEDASPAFLTDRREG